MQLRTRRACPVILSTFILDVLLISIATLHVCHGQTETPVNISWPILNFEAFDDYISQQVGDIGLYGSCKNKPPGACRFPLECFEVIQQSVSSTTFNAPCTFSSTSCICADQEGDVDCNRSSDCGPNEYCASFMQGISFAVDDVSIFRFRSTRCVSCSAALPDFAQAVGGRDFPCQSADVEIETNGPFNLSYDMCNATLPCSTGLLCSRIPTFSFTPFEENHGGLEFEQTDPSYFFRHCSFVNGMPCICRQLQQRRRLSNCRTSDECSVGDLCGSFNVDGKRERYCVSCNAPAGFSFDGVDFFDKEERCQNTSTTVTTKPSVNPPDKTAPPVETTAAASPAVTTSSPIPDSPSPSPAPCIAVDALGDMSAEDLVFSEHVRASVLCDRWNNCATPGHIVLFHNKAMMMRSYCALIGCTRSVKFVNSPRMQRGRRVNSKVRHLQFSTLSARHESVIEEAVLGVLLLFGF